MEKKRPQNGLKIIYIVLLALLGIEIISGIIFTASSIVYGISKEQHVTAFDMSTLTNEQLVAHVTYGEVDSLSYRTRGESSGLSLKYEPYDYDETYFEIIGLSGIQTVSMSKASNCILTLYIDSETYTDSENLMIAVILDNQIIQYVPLNRASTYAYRVSGEHFYTVKVVGDCADIDIEVTRTFTPLDYPNT